MPSVRASTDIGPLDWVLAWRAFDRFGILPSGKHKVPLLFKKQAIPPKLQMILLASSFLSSNLAPISAYRLAWKSSPITDLRGSWSRLLGVTSIKRPLEMRIWGRSPLWNASSFLRKRTCCMMGSHQKAMELVVVEFSADITCIEEQTRR